MFYHVLLVGCFRNNLHHAFITYLFFIYTIFIQFIQFEEAFRHFLFAIQYFIWYCILLVADMKAEDDFVEQIKNAMEMENIKCPKQNGYDNGECYDADCLNRLFSSSLDGEHKLFFARVVDIS